MKHFMRELGEKLRGFIKGIGSRDNSYLFVVYLFRRHFLIIKDFRFIVRNTSFC